MNYAKLKNIKKTYFDYGEIAKALDISMASARVSAGRFIKYGFLIRIKRNIYTLRERWDAMNEDERFAIANLIEVPSYISLMTALSYYQIATFIQRDFVESICTTRTKRVVVKGVEFNYTKIDRKLYFGFRKTGDFFMATPEKAIVDAVYLASLKRYSFDATSIDPDKLDLNSVRDIAKAYPVKTREMLKKYGYIKKA